jgi:hypothetical protein
MLGSGASSFERENRVRSSLCVSALSCTKVGRGVLWPLAFSFITPDRVRGEPEGTMTSIERELGCPRPSLHPMSHVSSPAR